MLRNWRKAKGMTQLELARTSGVNVSYISNLERGFSANTKSGVPKPSEPLVERFSKVLEVDLDVIRLAAGYAPIKKVLPQELAIMDYDGFDDEDLQDIADYINFKRMKKGLNK